MPYITVNDRVNVDNKLTDCGLTYVPDSMGEFNFLISQICSNFLKENGLSYSNLNSLIGVLDCAKMELYRIVASPYEDKKSEENGKVY